MMASSPRSPRTSLIHFVLFSKDALPIFGVVAYAESLMLDAQLDMCAGSNGTCNIVNDDRDR